VSDTLAPHQQRLAELVGQRPGGHKSLDEAPPATASDQDGDPADGLRAGWLTELRHDPSRALAGLRTTLAEHRGDAAQSKMLADLAMKFSVNNDQATPEDPSASQWCDFCGNSAPDDLEPGVDGPERPEMACRDDLLDECVARRERRYPPDLARVPQWIFDAQARLTDEGTRDMIVAACGAALGDYLELMAPAVAAGDELELAAQQQPHFPGWVSTEHGVVNTRGDWFPAPPPNPNLNWAHINWQHSLRNPAHRTHLISGGARWGAPAAAPPAQAGPAQGGAREIPPTGNPPGVEEALHGGHGLDLATQPHPDPAATPQRPARIPRDRFGNRRYPRRRGR
jgi:hypothetical protein